MRFSVGQKVMFCFGNKPAHDADCAIIVEARKSMNYPYLVDIMDKKGNILINSLGAYELELSPMNCPLSKAL